jgi:hypothetical protein
MPSLNEYLHRDAASSESSDLLHHLVNVGAFSILAIV